MDNRSFEIFTASLRSALEHDPKVLGLITLGSTADASFRDEWSDHDFWIVTESGAQDAYLDDFSWLPDAEAIAIKVPHGKRRRTLLYRNRHQVEFAVFDTEEAHSGQIERYAVLIDRGPVAELAASIQRQTLQQARSSRTLGEALENLCVLTWSASERNARGEGLSARQYLDGFAVNQLLRLLSGCADDGLGAGGDQLDPRRRLETRSPGLAAEILLLLEQPIPAVAIKMLDIAEREIKAKAPALGWDHVEMVRGWISELVGNT